MDATSLLLALRLALTTPPATAYVRVHAPSWSSEPASVATAPAYRLPSGRWALPAWVADRWPDSVWVSRHTVLRDRPDSVLNGWGIWTEARHPRPGRGVRR